MAIGCSWTYSKLDSHPEDTVFLQERNNSWLTTSFKFLQQLRGAPRAAADGRTEEPRPHISRNARQKSPYISNFGLQKLKRRNTTASDRSSSKHPKREVRPRSKSAMESSATEGAAATQVELRTDGFQATLLWERIVLHLERTVKPGRHSYTLRSYDNCFPGHKAVDCLMGYMNSVLPKSVKKNQARLLGQKLLLTRVIEDARNKDKTVFREGRLYRFTGIHFWEPPRDVHGSRGCSMSQPGAEGGLYRCHSIENVSHGCPSAREQKRKSSSSGRRTGYASDSTLASSSLSKRIVQVRSSRGKAAPRINSDKHTAKTQLSSSLAMPSTSRGLPNEPASSAYRGQQPRSSHRSRLPWFNFDSGARARDVRSKYRTPTITEEPAVLRSISPPRAPPMTPRSPAVDFKLRDPSLQMQERSRGLPAYPEPPLSPSSSVVSGISSYSRGSKDSSSVCREYALHRPEDSHQRLIPRPAVGVTPLSKHCNGHSDVSTEQDPGWIVYGYV